MTEQNKEHKMVEKIKHTGAITAPSLFTLGNLACGFFSIKAAAEGRFAEAGWMILFAAVFDMFDGRIARMLGTESNFGVEMDSLADTVSFCAAPAFLMYFSVLNSRPVLGGAIACFYTCLGVLRLAKFNTMALAGETSKKYFSGLPVPTPAMIFASLAICCKMSEMPFLSDWFPRLCNFNFVGFAMLAMGLLMVSKVPYAAFKGKRDKKMSVWTLLFLIFLVVMLTKFPEDVVFIVFSLYVLFGLLAVLYRAFRGIKVEK